MHRDQVAPAERRHGGRVASNGSVVVHAGAFTSRARIVDLAAGGVCVRMTAIPPPIGTGVRVDLRLDGVGSWQHLLGHIARYEPATGESVVVFADVPAGFEDAVQEELLASLECARTPCVLLVDPDHGRREHLAGVFRAIGIRAIQTSTPLEAIAELDESRLHPWAIMIADSADASADQLRTFLGARYPRVPMMTIGVA
jgi:hypothetical protein